jgi:predicted phage baseplate assembly protein
VHEALPAIWLHSRPIDQPDAAPELWKPVIDLLASGPDQAEFAVEIENDGAAYLRFGEPPFGRRPTAEEQFEATYRVGNGTRGNIGSDALYHIATETLDDAITGIRNPLPARGGLEMESIEEARRNAPEAFRNPIKRAVTPADYETLVNRHNEVQRCAARFRWTGSWYTVFITVDRLGGLPITPEFEARLRWYIEEFRMAGHDIEVDGPVYVPLEIGMEVCVNPDYFRDAVRDALLEVFNNRVLPDGRRGIFHPDNFTFGQTVYLSPLYAAAVAVEGVESVTIDPFQVQEDPSRSGVEDGKIVLERLQIARLDNDPNYPKRGVFRLTMRGGK